MIYDTIFLYRITAPDGRAYIGVAKNPRARWTAHRRNPKSALHDAIIEFGSEAMRFEVLACGSRDYILDLEVRAIAAFNTRQPNGLNRAVGGFSNRDPLPSTRAKLSASTKEKMLSPQRRAKALAGILSLNEDGRDRGNWGKPQTVEHVQKRARSFDATIAARRAKRVTP